MQSLLVDDGAEYTVHKILDRREVDGEFEYKVDWGPQWSTALRVTWELATCLENAKDKVQEYLDTHASPSSYTDRTRKHTRKKR